MTQHLIDHLLAEGERQTEREARIVLCGLHHRAVDRIAQLENFVNHMAGMTLPEEEFEVLREEFGEDEFGDVKADEWGSVTYDDVDEYIADLDDEHLFQEYNTFMDMIREARRLQNGN